MSHKDPEAKKAYMRARYARLKAEDPDWVAKQKEASSRSFKKKYAEDEAFRQKKAEDFKKWYDEHGKENARERKGYKSQEEYLAELEEDRRKKAEYMREWNKTEKGRQARVARSIKRRCGLTLEEYDRTYDEQEGKCKICQVQKERYAKDRLVVDHCHMSGKFRALLCSNCNSAIGLLGESEEIMINAIEYLRSLRSLKE